MNNGKILICNIIIAALAVVSIVTLWVGSFMKIQLKVNVNGKTINTIMDKSKGSSGGSENAENNISMKIIMDGEQNAENTEQEDNEKMLKDALESLDFDINLDFDLKSSAMIKSIGGEGKQVVQNVLYTQINAAVDNLLATVDVVFSQVIDGLVNSIVNKAVDEVAKTLKQELGKDATTAEVMKRMEEKYGIKEEDIGLFKRDIERMAKGLLNGEPDEVAKTIQESTLLDSLLSIYVESEIKAEKGNDYTPSEEEISAKCKTIKDDVVSEYNEVIKKVQDENGTFSKESVLLGLMNQSGIKDSEGNEQKFESVEDVKTYISTMTTEMLGDDAADKIAMVFRILGIFILVVMAAWAYVIIKIIIKLFMPNKAIGMFMPRFFGWMPHVFFVGLPMLVIKNVDRVIGLIGQQATEEVVDFLNMFTLNITSLSWISALCSVLLLIVWIPYHTWRREAKMGRTAR